MLVDESLRILFIQNYSAEITPDIRVTLSSQSEECKKE